MSVALTTKPFQSQQSAVFKCLYATLAMNLWTYGTSIYGIIFEKRLIVDIQNDIFKG